MELNHLTTSFQIQWPQKGVANQTESLAIRLN
jgi:hypothetical protein